MNDSKSQLVTNGRRRLTTVVAVDVCDFTKNTEFNEEGAIESVNTVFEIFQVITKSHRGRIFSRAGDGFFAEFPSALSGLNAATSFAGRISSELTPKTGVKVRVGLHVGDVVEQANGDLLGLGVNVAARLQQMALPNRVLSSANVMSLVGHSFQGKKSSRGKVLLKNISTPMLVYDLMPAKRKWPHLNMKRWWARSRPPVLTALMFLLVVLAWLNLHSLSTKSIQNAEERSSQLELALLKNDNGRTVRLNNKGISASYIRTVLDSLSESGRATSQATMALILEGDVESAIRLLEQDTENLNPDDPVYQETLHQIGALAYFREPQKAVAAYKILQLIDKNDQYSAVRLGQAYDVVNETVKARQMYEIALTADDISEATYLGLQIDLAFSQVLSGNPVAAVDILRSIETRVDDTEDPKLRSRLHTELGIALERTDNLIEAESNLLAALTIQRENSLKAEASRSYNVLGLIAEKRAERERKPDEKQKLLRHARSLFREQLRIDKELGRQHGISEAHYYVASISLELGERKIAEASALQALRGSSQNGIPNIEFMSWIMLAELSHTNGDREGTCKHLAEAQDVYDHRISSAVGPRTTQIIRNLDCPFEF